MAPPLRATHHASPHHCAPEETQQSWACLQELDFISNEERQLLRAGTGRFGVENLETRKAKWRHLDQVRGAVRTPAVFEQRTSGMGGLQSAQGWTGQGRAEAKIPVGAGVIAHCNAMSMVVGMERRQVVGSLQRVNCKEVGDWM